MSKTKELQPKAKMTATQRRKAVEVARDVLAQLRAKRITATCGTYLEVCDYDPEYGENVLDSKGEDSFQKVFKENKTVACDVCAIGAAYIGYINRFNRVTVDEVLSAKHGDMVSTLSSIFSQDQLRLMEAAFEGTFIREPDWYLKLCSEDNSSAYKVDRAIEAFHFKYEDNDQRLRAIMLNVIRNNGEFRLPLRVR